MGRQNDLKDPVHWDELVREICGKWGTQFLYPHQQLCIRQILESCKFFRPEPLDMETEAEHMGQAGFPWELPGNGAEPESNGNLLACLPTGSGKSLCFMAPAALIEGISIILYPLNALLRDQKRRFEQAGVPVLLFYGAMSPEERCETLDRLPGFSRGVIISNAESVWNSRFLDALVLSRVSVLIIDEAHLLLQWGRSFRPSLLRIIQFRALLGHPPTALFTATLTPEDRELLSSLIWPSEPWDHVEMLSDRPNIRYRLIPCHSRVTALRLILRKALDPGFTLLNEREDLCGELQLPTLIFVRTRRDCEDLSRRCRIWLRLWGIRGVDVEYYHAGLQAEERRYREQWFAASRRALLFTTKAFGTGVDIPGIRSTIHLEEPGTMEDFLQESGRAGRDGATAVSLLFQATDDRKDLFPDKGCRRRRALSVLGQVPPLCSGCDSCEGITWDAPIEEEAYRDHRRIQRRIPSPEREVAALHTTDFADMNRKLLISIGKRLRSR